MLDRVGHFRNIQKLFIFPTAARVKSRQMVGLLFLRGILLTSLNTFNKKKTKKQSGKKIRK